MSTITTLDLWRDPGYTDGCMEVPPLNSTLGDPDATYSDLNPSKDRLFSEIRVPGDFESLYDMCYLRAVYQMNNGDNVILYGWIDSVSVQSDTADYPITVISWHVDYWRTFASRASFGSGMVTRRPVDGAMPPQDYPHRFIQCQSRRALYDDISISTGVWWVIIGYSITDGEYSRVAWIFFPTARHSETYMSDGYYTVRGPPFDILGYVDEIFEIAPEQISVCMLSPIPPMAVSGSGTSSNPFTGLNIAVMGTFGGNSYGAYECYPSSVSSYETTVSAETTDTDVYAITGFSGDVQLILPWGIPITSIVARVEINGTAGNLVLQGRQTSDDGITDSNVEGLVCFIPLPTFDLSSNAWSSYVYNGSREVAAMQLQLNAQANLVSGLTGSINQATTGAIIGGASAGLAGAGVGAVVSTGASLLTTAVQYAYESGAYLDQMMEINDYEASHQQSSLYLGGTGIGFVTNGQCSPALVRYTYDDYSLEQRANDLEIYGCTVSEPTESCQSLIEAGGPLRINNLIVGGDIPAPAKTYLRERFSKGVILK